MSETGTPQNLEQHVQSLVGAKRLYEDLQRHPGWIELQKVLQDQANMRHNNIILNPLAGADGVYLQEFQKGECAGLKLAFHLPMQLVESLETEIAATQAEIAEGEDK